MLGMFKQKQSKDVSAQPKILIVDDEQDLLSTVQYRLKFANYIVVTARNGQEGLEAAGSEKPDLILLDTNMPVMDGHEMLKHLRAKPEGKSVPVIMLTAISAPEDIAAASAFGIADYITKPFDFNELLEKVKSTLNETSRV